MKIERSLKMGSKKEEIEKLKEKREENFKKLGQYLLQKKYYEKEVENLLWVQEKLCTQIIELEERQLRMGK